MIDEEILRALAHFQERIEEISIRFQELKDITYDLYQKNEKLKAENQQLKDLVFERENDGDNNIEDNQGYSNLIHLYDEGFHICHLSFGDKRERDCLFCIQLLEHRFDKRE